MNKKTRKLSVLLGALSILFSAVVCGYAQRVPTKALYKKVAPGDGAVSANRIRPHKVRYEKGSGSMIYDLRKVTVNGRDLFEVRIYFGDESGIPDRNYFDAKTLTFVRRKLELKNYTIDVKFDGGNFTGDLFPAKGSKYKPIKFNKKYEHAIFEPAIINYFIAALPLKEGYKASIPTIDLNNGSQVWWANIEVLGREKIKANGKTYDTWKVSSKGVREKTIWISTTKPYAIKMVTKGNFGAWLVDDSYSGKKSQSKGTAKQGKVDSDDPLGFFAGTWKRDGIGGFEKWKRTGAMSFDGKGYKLAEGKEQLTEEMKIKLVGEKVVFEVKLFGQGIEKPVTLAFAGVNANKFSFKNEQSQTITQIVYTKISNTEMQVNVVSAGGQSFSYKMIKQ